MTAKENFSQLTERVNEAQAKIKGAVLARNDADTRTSI